MEFGFIFLILAILFLRNRIRAAILQSQKEDFVREVIRRVDQKKKLDELYGRNEDKR